MKCDYMIKQSVKKKLILRKCVEKQLLPVNY